MPQKPGKNTIKNTLANRDLVLEAIRRGKHHIDDITIEVWDSYYSKSDDPIIGIKRTLTTMVTRGEIFEDKDGKYFESKPKTKVALPTPVQPSQSEIKTNTDNGIWEYISVEGSRRETWVSNTGGTLGSIRVDILDIPDPDDVHQINFIGKNGLVIHMTFVKEKERVDILLGRDPHADEIVRDPVHAVHIFTGKGSSKGYFKRILKPCIVSIIKK